MAYAISRAADAFRIPGPGTTANACGLPFASAAPKRHIGGGLFMPRVNDANAVRRFVRSVEEMVVVDAGQRKKSVNTVGEKRFDHGLGCSHTGNGVSSACRAFKAADTAASLSSDNAELMTTEASGTNAISICRSRAARAKSPLAYLA
jgi:hypothetical protein